jgi:hypothetical protein
MTKLLEQAITKLKSMSASEQDSIAAMILEELENNLRWDKLFSRSPNSLAKLADAAMGEYHAGRTQELDPEKL